MRAVNPSCETDLAPQPAPGPAKASILVVEDSDHVRTLMQRVLAMHGYDVLAAADGQQALLVAEANARPIDLLITDVVMPHLSGRQLAVRLMAMHPGLRVLYISGYTAGVLDLPGAEQEVHWFLQKPFTPDLLLRTVREILAGQKPA
jgi:two-component system, cell cycle sensor histidine kinase and response regulator CckA